LQEKRYFDPVCRSEGSVGGPKVGRRKSGSAGIGTLVARDSRPRPAGLKGLVVASVVKFGWGSRPVIYRVEDLLVDLYYYYL
jgi:hypothetical protein